MRYELTDLRVFLAIAQAQSLSAGAAEVHLTAPSASYRLKNLEQAMCASLFERTSKGMVLTPAGMTVKKYANSIFSSVDRLHSEMQRHVNGISGHIRVFANSSTLTGIAPVLSRYLAHYPNVNVGLEERLSEDTVRAVLDGSADVGLVAGHADLHGLHATTYGQDELVFVLPVGHPLAAGDKVSLETALTYDLVSIGRKTSNFLYLQNMASRLGMNPRVRVHAPTFEAVLQCVQEGVGVALVPRSIAGSALLAGRLCAVSLDESWAQREQKVVTRDPETLPGYARDFVAYVVANPLPEEGSPKLSEA
ncbi:LysR family transcriptional regulator [Comamonas testosteroni]|uniref:LysR family transcriptional regulator n=1 Tax=Comamonas testosteroni TaxID=285 RepID=UPI0015FA8A84|nr:LysR family transcriptional regulator [Comamonas testosteroni]